MKNTTSKLATATLIIAALFIIIHQFSDSLDRAIFARLYSSGHDRKCKTLTWKTTLQDKAVIIRGMALEPYYVKVEWPDGKVGLFDRCQRKVFLISPAKKTVRIVVFRQEVTDKYADIYDSIQNFRNMLGYSIEQIGRRRIGQKQAIGFRLTNKKDNEKIIVWTDPCSQLPMYIEFFEANGLGQTEPKMIWSDIVFDVELDESLFKFDLEGYKVEELDSLQLE